MGLIRKTSIKWSRRNKLRRLSSSPVVPLPRRTPSSRSAPETSELEATSSPREISPDSSNGPNTSESRDRRESSCRDSRSPQALPSLPTLSTNLNHVTQLVEDGTAKLVVIAHDVDPIEIMCFLPTLCRKKSVTYCFVRGKAALGRLVHQKTATCVALCGVNREDLVDFEKLTTQFNIQFNEDEKMRRTWGGGIMGIKNVHMMAAREKIRMIEQTKKETML